MHREDTHTYTEVQVLLLKARSATEKKGRNQVTLIRIAGKKITKKNWVGISILSKKGSSFANRCKSYKPFGDNKKRKHIKK